MTDDTTKEEPASRSDISKKITRSFWALGAIFFILLVALTVGYIVNGHRVKDIQDTRVELCKQIYTGTATVFRPLFTDPPQTPRRKHRAELFNDAIVKLKKDCNKLADPNAVTTITTVKEVP